ncbi:MAG TPA: LysR family transcriptional regulator [Gemmatimonadaceae bacterium]|nr:LysR family transcriptional regulator [Gemmatimonadaceae bacterium]
MPTSVARKPARLRRATTRSAKSKRVNGASPGGSPRLLDGRVQTRLKGWLTCDGEFFIGPRYIRLLEAVGVAGTIRGACEQCDMSYRTCINRIRHMERILGAPILDISRGGSEHGSAKLTPLARRLIDVYHEWHRAIVAASDSAARRLLKA